MLLALILDLFVIIFIRPGSWLLWFFLLRLVLFFLSFVLWLFLLFLFFFFLLLSFSSWLLVVHDPSRHIFHLLLLFLLLHIHWLRRLHRVHWLCCLEVSLSLSHELVILLNQVLPCELSESADVGSQVLVGVLRRDSLDIYTFLTPLVELE